jgi:cytidylate kinase
MNTENSLMKTARMRTSPLSAVVNELLGDPEWSAVARCLAKQSANTPSLHLAVFVEPFLGYILSGKKTVESRFSSVRFPPYGRVSRGDFVLLKASGGPVVGIAEVGAAWFYRLDAESWRTIRRDFAAAICAEDPAFWKSREKAEFATLMYVTRTKRLQPILWPKRDRRGWVVLRGGEPNPLFGGTMRSTVLAFSGGIASGKSTLSESVALALGVPRVSFGGYMRSEAKRRGLPSDRDTLQSIGEKLVRDDPEGLCRAVLAQSGWTPGAALIIDGVRHADIASRLTRLVQPSDFRLVHVAATQTTRAVRLASRGESALLLPSFDSHSTEREVCDRLPEEADLVVRGEQPIELLVEQVAKWAETLS